MATFTVLDYAILLVFFASLLTGLSRGFIREIVALFTWVAAFIVAGTFSHQLAAIFTSSQAVQSTFSGSAAQPVSMVALGIAFICLFVATLVAGSVVNMFLSGAGLLSFTNRILGGLFGLARGYLINLVVLFVLSLTALTTQPWWTNSQLEPSFEPAIQWLSEMVQPGLTSLKQKMGNTLQDLSNQFQNTVNQIYPSR